jgi:hypothetical protein
VIDSYNGKDIFFALVVLIEEESFADTGVFKLAGILLNDPGLCGFVSTESSDAFPLLVGMGDLKASGLTENGIDVERSTDFLFCEVIFFLEVLTGVIILLGWDLPSNIF